MLRKSLFLVLSIFSFSLHAFENTEQETEKVPSITYQKNLYRVVLVGATLSLLLWIVPTFEVIDNYGLWAAVKSTHIPRVVLDALTITSCCFGLGLLEENESISADLKELRNKIYTHQQKAK